MLFRAGLYGESGCNEIPDFVAHNFAIMTVSLITPERV